MTIHRAVAVVMILFAAWLLLPPVLEYPCPTGYDESFYISQAISLAYDFDADLDNDFRHVGYRPRGVYGAISHFAIGTSVGMTPWILAGRAMGFGTSSARLFKGSRMREWLALWSVVVGLAAFLVAARISNGFAAWMAFALSPMLYWTVRAPGYSHASSALVVTLLIAYSMRERRSWWLAGALLGLVYITRWADVLYGVVLLPLLWRDDKRVIASLKISVSFLAVASIQWVWWRAHCGAWGNPYPTGALTPFSFPIGQLGWWERNAFLLYCPIAPVALYGLIRARRWTLIIAGVLALYAALILTGIGDGGDGGAGLGMRRVTSLYPILAIGLANAWPQLQKRRWVAMVGVAVMAAALWWSLFMVRQHEISYYERQDRLVRWDTKTVGLAAGRIFQGWEVR